MSKKGIIAGIILVIIIAGGIIIFVNQGKKGGATSGNATSTVSYPKPGEGEIAVTGYTACLKPTSGPDCVLGVAGSDGKTYALNLVAGEIKDEDLPVYIVGTYTPNASSSESGGLVYDGVINVRIIQREQ